MIDCSVIIPHFNQLDDLRVCVDALNGQKVNGIKYEIIVVDNCSECDLDMIDRNSAIRLLRLCKTKNPYACRNLGIRKAKGQILCFLDAKCIPSQSWLQNGYDRIKRDKYDIIGGRFEVQSTSQLSSKVFPLMYLNTLKNIKMGYGLPCGNLFVKSEIFESLGLFSTKSRSGNDIQWTNKAQKAGYGLGYGANCIVKYPSKVYSRMLIDVKKYGEGAIVTGEKNLYSILPYLMPLKLSTFNESLQYQKMKLNILEAFQVWLLMWGVKVHFAIGMLNAYYRSLSRKPIFIDK